MSYTIACWGLIAHYAFYLMERMKKRSVRLVVNKKNDQRNSCLLNEAQRKL